VRVHADRHTDARIWTHGQRKTGFIICPMLYTIAMGQIMTYSDNDIKCTKQS